MQRDYVFGWLLSGIYQTDNPLHRLLVLKGGNCFRKAYFEHTRYSNDLDFSSQVRVEPDTLQCLQLEELLASKLRALLHRHHSPELYDFVNAVFVQKVLNVSRTQVLTTFLKQTIYEPDPQAAKGLLLQLPFQLLRSLWHQYLVCPKTNMISFEEAQTWFTTTVSEIFALAETRYGYVGAGDWGRTRRYFAAEFRDKIIEAGRLQRLIRLGYEGRERVVEPYALAFKRKVNGDAREYFYGWSRSGGRSGPGIRAYTADKVQSISLTEEAFEPRYPIETAKTGGFFARPFSSGERAPRRRLSAPFGGNPSRGSAWSNEYTVECPVCSKRFKRTKYDAKLNPHKGQYGNNCYGRIGYIV